MHKGKTMGYAIKDTGNERNAWYYSYGHPYVTHKVSVPLRTGLIRDYRLKCNVYNTRAKCHQSSYVMDAGNRQLLEWESAQWLAATVCTVVGINESRGDGSHIMLDMYKQWETAHSWSSLHREGERKWRK